MRLTTALVVAAVGASATGGVWLHGRHYGVQACEAAHQEARERVQRDLHAVADDLSEQEFGLRQAQDALAARAQEHEDAAAADVDPCRLPSADSLRRLSRRWAADPATPD